MLCLALDNVFNFIQSGPDTVSEGTRVKFEMERTDFNLIFSCPICFCPSINIVFGSCRHYVCSQCLYDDVDDSLRSTLLKCPICKWPNAFLPSRPVVPESTRQLMRLAGLVKCKHKRCGHGNKNSMRRCAPPRPHGDAAALVVERMAWDVAFADAIRAALVRAPGAIADDMNRDSTHTKKHCFIFLEREMSDKCSYRFYFSNMRLGCNINICACFQILCQEQLITKTMMSMLTSSLHDHISGRDADKAHS
ncbi:uncharacterized protein ISCGN_000824 [Ixodes scapularis]